MPKHLEMQLRSTLAALFLYAAIAGYNGTYRDKFVSDSVLCLFLSYIACLIIIGFNHDSGLMAKALAIMDGIRDAINSLVNGKDRECRQRHQQERERDNAS